MKHFVLILSALFVLSFQSQAEAQAFLHHHPHPPIGVQPAPYPAPYYPGTITCYAQGLWNGVVFYGFGPNAFIANDWAMRVCLSSGQACRPIGCQY